MTPATLTQSVNKNFEIKIWIFGLLFIDETMIKNIKNLQSIREERNKPHNSIDV